MENIQLAETLLAVQKGLCSIHLFSIKTIVRSSIPTINPTPRPYLKVMWIHTLLYPGGLWKGSSVRGT